MFPNLKTVVIILISIVLFTACKRNQFIIDVSEIPEPKIQISDYGTALFSLNRDSIAQELKALQNDFSLFLGTDPLIDEQIIQLSFYINDPFLNDLYNEFQSAFPSLEPLEKELAGAFRYLFYYFPDNKLPEVFAYISGVQNPVIFQDNILVLGLDNYLGSDCEIYARIGTPRYKIRSMTSSHILRDVFSAVSLEKIPAPAAGANILEYMIYEAKKLYFVKSMIPEINDSILLNFTEEQLVWYNDNEKDLWKYYIENELLFKTDYDSIKKFINDAPFTSVLGNNSPPRTGVWLGYQILLSYSENSEISLKDILSNDNALEILNKSKYKPGR